MSEAPPRILQRRPQGDDPPTSGVRAPRARLVMHTESSSGFGGQEIRIIAEARWLLAHGWDVLVACQPGSHLLPAAREANLPVVALKMAGVHGLRAVSVFRRLIRERGIALVHTHSSVDSWLGVLAARSCGVPVVRGRHVTIPIVRRRALVYHLADRIITSGEAVKALVVAAGVPAAKVVSITAGLDTTRFHPGVSGEAVRRELGLTGAVVGLVANIRGSKGHVVFLEAAAAVLREAPSTRFLIVGDGVGYELVRDHVGAMKLGDAVIMTGFRKDVPEVIAALDVLALPSLRSEAVSQVVLQAFAVGTPVVASAVGGNPELVRDGETGRLVPPGDPGALAGALLALLRDPLAARGLARAAQAEVLAGYSQDQVMARTTAVYEDLLRAGA